MIVAITGDRNWGRDRYPIIHAALSRLLPGDFVVLGDARGVDHMAKLACIELGLNHQVYVAKWRDHRGYYRRWAGPERNKAMLDHGVHVVWYFHDDLDNSKGTKNMVEQATKREFLVVDDGQRIAAGGEL